MQAYLEKQLDLLAAHPGQTKQFLAELNSQVATRRDRRSLNRKPCSSSSLVYLKGKAPTTERGLRVGIHCQTLCRDDGYISGSEFTTLGLMKALANRSDVFDISRFGPGRYHTLLNVTLDIFFVEGYHSGIEDELYALRETNPNIKIFFWNLSLSGLRHYIRLPTVDMVWTNSFTMYTVDSEAFRKVEYVPLAAPAEGLQCTPSVKYAHNILFVGEYTSQKSERDWKMTLGEAAPFGLAIYGKGWETTPWAAYHKGFLPFDDLNTAYCSAKIVINVTRDKQKRLGMVNNRVFEVIAAGGFLVSDHFTAMEELFGESVMYIKKEGDTTRIIESVLADETLRQKLIKKAKSIVMDKHLYNHRAHTLLKHYKALGGKKPVELSVALSPLTSSSSTSSKSSSFNQTTSLKS